MWLLGRVREHSVPDFELVHDHPCRPEEFRLSVKAFVPLLARRVPGPQPRSRSLARIFAAATDEWVANCLAIVALCLGLMGEHVWLAVFTGSLVLAVVGFLGIPFVPGAASSLLGRFVLSRVLVVLLAVSTFADQLAPCILHPWLNGWLAATGLAMTIVSEEPVRRVLDAAHPHTANFPATDGRNRPLINAGWVVWCNFVAVVVFAIIAGLGGRALWLLLVVCVTMVPTVLLLVDGVIRFRDSRRAQYLARHLAEWEPEFAVYWDAPPGTEFQLRMWLPHIERLGRRGIVIVRNAKTFRRVAQLTSLPVIFRRRPKDLDDVVVPSLTTAFYVNNSMRNSHFVRYPQLVHVQLNHGDSEKAPSFNPVTRMYDKNFVAGQAAIDRFAAHGVPIAADLCQIVGRPQVVGIDVGPRADANTAVPVVLYAPTWRGNHGDSAYSSLEIGAEIVRGLLKRGCTVIFRPHPYSANDPEHARTAAHIRGLLARDAQVTGRRHAFGEDLATTTTLFDNFNAADALVSDVSSVVSDFLYSEKPFAVTVMQGSDADCRAELPVARVAHLITRDLATLDASLDGLIGDDNQRAEREQMKHYYLGDFPADEYAEAFGRAVTALLDAPPRPSATG